MKQQLSRSKSFLRKYKIHAVSLLLFLNIASSNLSILAQSDKNVDNYFNVISKTGVMRWPASSMPLHVCIRSGDTTEGFRPDFVSLLEQAFSEWAAVLSGKVSFAFTSDPSKAQIICDWTSDKNNMTKLTEGGHALVVPDGHNIKNVQITILTKTVNGAVLTDQFFKRVALHEVGHTLGITDHSPDPADMMYSNPPGSTKDCTLTTRDKNTANMLYSLSQTSVEHSNLNIASMLPDKDNKSNLARIIRLNAEASKAMQTKNLAVAVAKLEEAHRIDPNNSLVNGNLGAAYGNCAVVAVLIHDNQRADIYFNKALPLLAKLPNSANYVSILKYYDNFLRGAGRKAEAEKVETKIKSLTGH